MKRSTILLYTFIGLVCLLNKSCYKDKGNYTYTSLNEIVIDVSDETIQETYAIDRSDILKISPKIFYNGEQINRAEDIKEKLTFTWSIYQNFSGSLVYSVDTLSREIDLEAAIYKPAGRWIVKLAVKDLENNTETYHKFEVTVNEVISDGWMVLYEIDDNTDVGLIVDERIKNGVVRNRLFLDLLKNTNGQALSGKPVTILHPTSNLTKGGDVIITSENDLIGVNKDNFQLSYRYEDFFWAAPAIRKMTAYTTIGGKEFFINNNRLYNANFSTISFNRTNNKMSPPIGNDALNLSAWQPKKYLATLDGLVYDSNSKRFLKLTAGAVNFTPYTDLPAAVFNPNNVGLDLVAYDWGYATGVVAAAYEYLIMKDNTDMYLLTGNFASAADANVPLRKQNINNNPDIQNISCMSVAYIGQYLLYGAQNKVYRHYFNTLQVAESLWTAPAGEIVTDVALQKFFFVSFHAAGILPNGNQYVYFATWNESEKQGKVYSYKIDQVNGNLDLSSERVYEGFGKIKEMTYKWSL